MYALIDVSGMYASCESVFDPSIRNKPIAVLTNNDGCICALNPIGKRLAKEIGVKKFTPYFQVKDVMEKAGFVIRSSNYALYADLSQRMMDTCSTFAQDMHVYSIDECFLDLRQHANNTEQWHTLALQIRRKVWKDVRLPVGVGLGTTPTLAKAANHASTKLSGFTGTAVIDNDVIRQSILTRMDVTDVWGIGKRLGNRLKVMGIHNAWELANLCPTQARKSFSILVENTIRELNGQVRLSWDETRAPKKEIYSTRSFGQRITSKDALLTALAGHAHTVGAKLRKQSSMAKGMIVFANSSPHDTEPHYRKSLYFPLTLPSQDTSVFLRNIHNAIHQIFKPNVKFYKCGVGLVELQDAASYQPDLFNTSPDNPLLMSCLDDINSRYGRDTVAFAIGKGKKPFAMKRAFLSPQYTTNWRDIPRVSCK